MTTPAEARARADYLDSIGKNGTASMLRSLSDQVEALTAELNNVGLPKLAMCPACTEEVSMLECDQLTQDAKRYRWLRNRMPGQAYRVAGIIYGEISEVDKQIDAAIAKGTDHG